MAGESVHFYDEVQQHDKIPVTDTVRRIYMARHIIEKYITAGNYVLTVVFISCVHLVIIWGEEDNCLA